MDDDVVHIPTPHKSDVKDHHEDSATMYTPIGTIVPTQLSRSCAIQLTEHDASGTVTPEISHLD